MTDRAGRRILGRVLLVVAVVAASVSTAAVAAAAQDATTPARSDCPAGDDGAVFRTDGGLAVTHDGRSVDANPFVNETTLSFPNVTVSASDNASLRVAAATGRRLCVSDVTPTDAAVVVAPAAGPRILVADALENLAYGTVDYDRARSRADLIYSARSAARVDVVDGRLEPGRTVQAVDAENGTVLDDGRVTDDRRLELRLPEGTRAVDLRFAPATTATETPDPDGNGTDANSAGAGPGSDGGSNAGTETERTPNATVQSVDWADEVVDYDPSPQTQHVGGFLPVTILLWLVALWILITRRSTEARLLAAVLVTASVRATSDLLQVLLDGFVGIEASVAALNLSLELALSVLFVQFGAAYAGEGSLRTRRARRTMSALVVLGAGGILTDPLHGLVFADVEVATAPFTYVATTPGPGAWLVSALDTVLLVWGGWLVMRSLVGPSIRTVWRPLVVIGTGLCLGVVLGVVSLLGRGPVAGYDYSATGVYHFVLLTAGTLLVHGFKRLKTSGERSVVADLDDAVVILDDAWAVVEFNDAAGRLFPEIDAGRAFDPVLEKPTMRPPADGTTTVETSVSVGPAGGNGGADEGADDTPAISPADGLTADADADDETPVVSGDESPVPASASSDGPPADAGADRRRKHFRVSVTTVTTEASDVIGYAVRFADVTDLKRDVMTLEAKNDQLDGFATAVAQDLRTPLATAERSTGQAVRLLESADGPNALHRSRLSEYLHRADDALIRMGGIIEDILGLARDSRLETETRAVAFDRTASSAWEAVDDTDATLRIESSGEITADPDHLRRLLTELFRNSVEHGSTSPDADPSPGVADHGDSGVTVRVGLERDGFYVADDGPGVPAQVRDGLFELGVTTDDQRAGLGLAIARQRAHTHDWEIELGANDAGTRFLVTGCDSTPERGEPSEENE